MQNRAKEALASGTITVSYYPKNKQQEKEILVPDWLFDLATRRDDVIFNTDLPYLENDPSLVEKMSKVLFTELLIQLKAKHKTNTWLTTPRADIKSHRQQRNETKK